MGDERVRSGRSTLIAEVYDFDKPIDGFYDDVEYYKRLLSGMGGRVLELACGTGRILVPLLEAGVQADGLDHSPEMLDVCREHCRARGLDSVLYEGDMASFDVPQVYDVVVVASGAVKELDGRDATLQSLRSCYKCLVPGGRLLVDLRPPRLEVTPGPIRHWTRGRNLWTLDPVLLDYDAAANRTTQLIRYEKWEDSKLVASEMHRFCMQDWTLTEFEGLLGEAGFVDVSVAADYRDGNPPGPHDEDWTFHSTRP